MHELRVHDMLERVLVFSPDDTMFNYYSWVIAQIFKSAKCFRAERGVRVSIETRVLF
jgi:hypothetical protein